MRSFEILKKAVSHDKFADAEQNDIEALTHDLITELDSELTSEEYEEGEKVVDLCDKLEVEMREADEEEEDEEDEGDEEDDDEDDEDDEFEGIDEDDEDETDPR